MLIIYIHTKFHDPKCKQRIINIMIACFFILPIPVAERSKAWVCSRWPAGIGGSNPAGGMDVCVVLLYSKDKRQSQDNQDKAIQIKYKVFQKKIPPGAWMFFCCECCVCEVEISATG